MRSSAKKDKVAVITGATKGLGKALSLAFAKAGYEVLGIYRDESGSAEMIESEFKAGGFFGRFIRQDITEDGDWIEFDKIVEMYRNKHLTLIANASSPFIPKPLHLTDWTEISDLMEVNVKGTFQIFKRLLPYMVRARSGTLITILSSVLKALPKGFGSYLIAKSALEGLTKASAAEYSKRGLRIFSVSPGFMKTSLTDAWSLHLKELIYHQENGAVRSPEFAARIILSLAERPDINAEGENYLLNGLDHEAVIEG